MLIKINNNDYSMLDSFLTIRANELHFKTIDKSYFPKFSILKYTNNSITLKTFNNSIGNLHEKINIINKNFNPKLGIAALNSFFKFFLNKSVTQYNNAKCINIPSCSFGDLDSDKDSYTINLVLYYKNENLEDLTKNFFEKNVKIAKVYETLNKSLDIEIDNLYVINIDYNSSFYNLINKLYIYLFYLSILNKEKINFNYELSNKILKILNNVDLDNKIKNEIIFFATNKSKIRKKIKNKIGINIARKNYLNSLKNEKIKRKITS